MIFSKNTYALDDKSRDMCKRLDAFFNDNIAANQTRWAEANLDLQFLVGSQEFYNSMYGPLFPGRRKNFYFNHIKPITEMICGRQRQNRKTTVVLPQHQVDEDTVTADQLSKVMMWVHENDNVYDTVSEAFTRSVATGMSLLQVYVDYRSDPISGDIKVDCCPYNTFLIDNSFTKKDLSDCSALWKRSYLTRREVLSLLPDNTEEIMAIRNNDKAAKFYFDRQSYGMANPTKLTYDEFWYRDFRTQKRLIDTKTGDTFEWRDDDDTLQMFLWQYPTIIVEECEVPTVNCAILVEGHVIVDSNMFGIDDLPFVPVISYYYPELSLESERIQGVVRSLRDAQYLYNRKMIIEADSLESVPNSGFIYKEDALVDPSSIFNTGDGRGIAVKANYNIQESVVPIQPFMIPPTTQDHRKDLKAEMNQISGASEELLGSASDDVAGILSRLRQGAGLTTLQTLFDNLDQAQRRLGEIVLNLIQTNFMPGKVQKIIGQQELSKQFHNHVWSQFNCVVEEGVYTATQKQMQFVQLMELKKLGIAVPDDVILEAATIQNKKELLDSVRQSQQQAAQMQQQQMQLQMQELQSRTEMAQARAAADRGSAIERVSRVAENESLAIERKAEAKKDEEQAVLNMVKAIKEIEQIDLAQLEKLIFLTRQLAEPVTAGQQTDTSAETAKVIQNMGVNNAQTTPPTESYNDSYPQAT
jgi:hypothetical protein